MAAAGLGERLRQAKAAQDARRQATTTDEELPHMIIDFGKHKGKSFQAVAQEDWNYTVWCADHLWDEKPINKLFLRYLNMLADQAGADTGGARPSTGDSTSSEAPDQLKQRVDAMEAKLVELAEKMHRIEALLSSLASGQE